MFGGATVGHDHAIAEQVRRRLLHDVATLDTALIHVNPCGHHGVDPRETVRHHDEAADRTSRFAHA